MALPVFAIFLIVVPNCFTPSEICVNPVSNFFRASSGFRQLPLKESTALKKDETLPTPVTAPCLIPPNASNTSLFGANVLRSTPNLVSQSLAKSSHALFMSLTACDASCIDTCP